MADQKGRVLLPPDVEPERYIIKLTPDLEKFSFDGEETVLIQVVNATNSISVHTKELYIKQVSVELEGGESVAATSMAFDISLTLVKFTFEKEIPKGVAKIHIAFEGCLNDKMAGFYRSGYTAANGEKRVMASTQFEALDARRCFPCWDEPSRKAVFEVTLVVPSDRVAISNMPEAGSHEMPGGRQKAVKFMPSPKMSTYLLAFCVGEFDFVGGQTKNGVLCRVFSPPGKSHMGAFALDVCMRTLDLYDDFFKIPYPLPKLDMIAIPEFAMGAMENWGLVTYREVDVLLDDKKASSQQRQRVCTVVAHELAHQWFGNLVTMAWWDDLWLNEGFATWTQSMAANALFPDWTMWAQFAVHEMVRALQLDSLRQSHPIQVPIAHAEEVEQVFDAISYCKGACVVKMAYAVLGLAKFQEGLQLYFERHQYGNTETTDLWSAWEEVSGKPIQALMASWTEQMGHPVVSIVREEWSGDSVKLKLQQKWFLADGSEIQMGEEKTWKIPLMVATASDPKGQLNLMEGEMHEVTVPLGKEGDWVALNYGQNTLMRVQYSPEMIKRFEVAVRDKTLPPEDRAGLLHDCYALARAGSMAVGDLVHLLAAYRDEDESTVWELLEMVLLGLDKAMVEDEKMHARFVEFAATKLVSPLLSKVGWEAKPSDGHLSKMLRGCTIRLLKAFMPTDAGVAAEAKRRFDGHVNDVNDHAILPADCTVPVYQIVLKGGGEPVYNRLIDLWGSFEDNADKKMVFSALGHAPTKELKLRACEWALADIKLQDFFYILMSVSGSGKLGLETAWEFYQNNFERFKKKLAGSSPSLTDACIVACSGGFADEAKINEVEAFYKAHPLPNNQRKIAQVLEAMRTGNRFLKSMATSPLTTDEFWAELMKC